MLLLDIEIPMLIIIIAEESVLNRLLDNKK